MYSIMLNELGELQRVTGLVTPCDSVFLYEVQVMCFVAIVKI